MDKGVPEGTLRVEIRGKPESFQELEDLRHAIHEALLWPDFTVEDQDMLDQLNSQFFEQPYRQGGGFVVIERITLEEYLKDEDNREEWEWRLKETAQGRWTNCYITDWYTDSMTGPYSTPLFQDEEGTYRTWEP